MGLRNFTPTLALPSLDITDTHIVGEQAASQPAAVKTVSKFKDLKVSRDFEGEKWDKRDESHVFRSYVLRFFFLLLASIPINLNITHLHPLNKMN